MSILRQLAKQGHAVLALSATKRDAKGNHNSQELSLSSFKESGEVEYQADSAYVLRDDGDHNGLKFVRKVTLGHVKNRHGAKVDRELIFDMPAMRFDAAIDAAIDEPQSHSDFLEYATADGFGGDD
jgi:replicative DNA helicase